MLKEGCNDIFKNCSYTDEYGEQQRIFEILSEKKYLQLKLDKHMLNYQYQKLNLISKLQLFHGQYLIKLLLKKI